jgi:hypothetical protein
MNERNEFSLPDDLEELGERLSKERPRLSAIELDQIKAGAMTRAGRATRQGKGQFMRSRLATIVAAFALVVGGGGAVWAAAGGDPGSGGSSGSAPNNQYCPPSSNNPGHPKHEGGGNKCGHGGHGHGHGHGDEHGHGHGHGDGDEHGHGHGKGD